MILCPLQRHVKAATFNTMHFLLFRNVNIAYTIYPEGNLVKNQPTPVFVLHGLFGSKSNWRSLAKRIALETKRQVIKNALLKCQCP